MKKVYVVILSICFCTLFCPSYFAQQASSIQKAPLTVELIWKDNEFASKGVGGFNGMKDGQHFTKFNSAENNLSITKHSYTNISGEGEIILSSKDLYYKGQALEIDSYSFNNDETKLLLMTNSEPVYRRSYTSTYYIYDLKSKALSALDESNPIATLAEFSPNGEKIAYIADNNIYVKDLKSNKIIPVTKDGKFNAIINGTTDWVYEEEFAITKAFGWSPDSKHIAFLKFDESQVKEFTLEYYSGLYPFLYKYKYPKAGENNSRVSAHIYTIDNKKTTQISLGSYAYIPRINWSGSENKLILQTLNRHQNHVKYHLVDWTKGNNSLSKVFYEEKSDTYVDIDDNLLILNDGKSILRTSEASGFNHIYKIGFNGSSSQITNGNWDVIEFLGIDEQSNTVFYSSAEEGAIYKGIYSVQLDGNNKTQLSESKGYNHALFTEGMKYFIRVSSTANTPKRYVLCKATGEEINVLESNEKLQMNLQSYWLSEKEFITIKGAEEELNAWMIKPPDFDPTKKYPVYLYVYGGPGSNTVKDEFDGNNYMYHQLLAQRGYIVVSVDPRGTQYRGAKFKKSTYLQLGKLELEDFIAVAGELGKLSYVDKSRIGIQGWSYGGYMSSLAMTKGNGVFKMGIAIAPVTNWRYYDNIYTERFLRSPQENPGGYDENSPIHFAKNLKGNYLLIHGDADDNVHCQNAMDLISALVNANVQFDMFIYPNKDHGIYGGNTRNHLYNMIFNYTLNKL